VVLDLKQTNTEVSSHPFQLPGCEGFSLCGLREKGNGRVSRQLPHQCRPPIGPRRSRKDDAHGSAPTGPHVFLAARRRRARPRSTASTPGAATKKRRAINDQPRPNVEYSKPPVLTTTLHVAFPDPRRFPEEHDAPVGLSPDGRTRCCRGTDGRSKGPEAPNSPSTFSSPKQWRAEIGVVGVNQESTVADPGALRRTLVSRPRDEGAPRKARGFRGDQCFGRGFRAPCASRAKRP